MLTETMTATTGDSLTLRCQESATPIGNTGVLHGIDHWTVISGTGRFANASGSGSAETYVYNLSLFAKVSTGTIAY